MLEAEESIEVANKNVENLLDIIDDYKRKYKGVVLAKDIIEKKKQCEELLKSKKIKKASDWLYYDGWLKALTWVLSRKEKENVLLQKDNIYQAEHRILGGRVSHGSKVE